MSELHVKLTLIPQADILADRDHFNVLVCDNADGTTVIIRATEASGPVSDCGSCGVPLMVGIQRGQVKEFVLLCPACGAYNHTSR